MITQEYVRKLFDYEQDTGDFVWRRPVNNRVFRGMVAGDGKHIAIHKVKYPISHLVWLWHRGHPIPIEIDHIDTNRQNNRIENLRIATRSQQLANTKLRKDNASGIKGVSWSNQNLKWMVQIAYEGKRYTVGFFDDLEEAVTARRVAAEKLHGEYARS